MIHVQEIKNKRIGWTVTIIVHALLLLFLWLYKAWPFNPPVEPLYGVQINFGTSDFGSGDVQAESAPSVTETEEVNEASESSEAASSSEATEATEATESNENADVQENVTTTSEESNVNSQQQTQVEKQITKTDAKTDAKEKTETLNTNDAYPTQKNNNGNDADKVGDKGQPDGKINDSDIYKGVSGAGGGEGANITGWQADGKPQEYTKSNETGKVVFEIQIDEEGEVEYVKVLEKTLSAEVVLFYQRQIERITFTAKADNPHPAAHSKGTYTIIVKAR